MKSLFCTFVAGILLSGNAFAANPEVELKTSMGVITLELYADKAPKTVENFLQYVKSGQYKRTIFHRVIPGFMIQGGGFDASFVEKATREPIQNEAANGLKNDAGTIAMARKSDPHSATAQFYINVNDNQPLNFAPGNPGYAVFGKVVKGMDVVNKIAAVPTGPGPVPPHQDVPRKPVVIEDARILSAGMPAAK
jgi:peptidyl-prolyl cis-trans isomerase A (cyclophilin A)/peptidyl-prolyl cis-trans isomerase B (cyclophilin B)